MVSLQTILIVAGLGAAFIFRDKIAAALAQTGKALGGGAGAAFGEGLTAFGAQFAAPFQEPAAAVGKWWEGVGPFLEGGGYAGQFFREKDIQIGSGPADIDPVITPQLREYADARAVGSKFQTTRSVVPTGYTPATATELVTKIVSGLKPTGLGHAERARLAIQETGFSPLGFAKEQRRVGESLLAAVKRLGIA